MRLAREEEAALATARSAPPARNYHRFQRNTFLQGMGMYDDSSEMAEIKVPIVFIHFQYDIYCQSQC